MSIRGKKLFLLLIIMSFLFLTISNVKADEQAAPILYTKYSTYTNIVETVFDENNQMHVFLGRSDNYYYKIIHIFNGKAILIDANANNLETFFKAKSFPGGVALFYLDHDITKGDTLYYYYYFINNGSHGVKVITKRGLVSNYKVNIFKDESKFTVVTAYSVSYYSSEVSSFNCSFNGNVLSSESYDVEVSMYKIEGFIYQNEKIFYYYYDDIYNESSYLSFLLFQGINKDGVIFNSSVVEYPNSYSETIITQGLDHDFYIQTIQEGKVFYYSFDENETFGFSDYSSVDFYIYYVNEYSIEQSSKWINTTFIDYEYAYYSGYSEGSIITILVLVSSYNSEHVLFTRFEKTLIFENDFYPYSLDISFLGSSYYLVYASKSIEKGHYNETNILGVYIRTNDSNFDLPEEPIYYEIKHISDFAYFMRNYWWTLLVIFSIIGGLYGIFHKRINKSIHKVKKFLLRPVVENVSTVRLIFINIWLFFYNTYSLVLSLWKVNKKRLIINIFGLSILAFVLINTSVLYNSEQATVLQKYFHNYDFGSNYDTSIDFTKSFIEQSESARNISLINENYTFLAAEDIMKTLKQKAPTYANLIVDYQITDSISIYTSNTTTGESTVQYFSINSSYNFVLRSLLVEGTLPKEKGEVIVSSEAAENLDLQVGEIIQFNSISDKGVFLNYDKINLTVSGIYSSIGYNTLSQLCKDNKLPFDPVRMLSYDMYSVISYNQFFLKNLENFSLGQLTLQGSIEFIYDFSSLDLETFDQLAEEYDSLTEARTHYFKFDPTGTWSISYELGYIIYSFKYDLITMRFLIYLITIPIVFIALFLLSEVNSIFASSFKQEIEILQSQGLSVGRITFIYSSMKFGESIVGTLFGLLGTFIFTPILLKVDKFLQFTNPIYLFTLKGSFVTIIVTFFALIIASLPRIIKLAKQSEKKQKEPKRFVTLIKRLRLHYFLVIIFGIAIALGGYYLVVLFSWIFEEELSSLIVIFVSLMGIGAMIAIFGVGLLIRELHNLLLIVLSKLSWKIKKSIRSFSLIEVRSDAKLFTNTFFSFLLIIAFVVPSIIVPLAIQDNFNDIAYFSSGADIYVSNWSLYNSTLKSNLTSYDEVISVANISVIESTYGELNFRFLVIDNITEFRSTIYDVPKYIIPNFNELLAQLEENDTMLVSKLFNKVFLSPDKFTFTSANETMNKEVKIGGEFTYFPIFFYGDRWLDDDVNIYYFDYFWYDFHIVLTNQTFTEIKDSLKTPALSLDRLLIKLKPNVNPIEFSEKIKRELNIDSQNAKEQADLVLFQAYPFYNVLTSMFVFMILMSIFAVAFISLSNPLKLLIQKASKNDILRKLGVRVNRIINISAFEIFVSSFIPGIIIGGFGAYGLYRFLKYIFIDFGWYSLPYKSYLFFPVIGVVVGIFGALYYIIFYFSMKVNFYKYRPRNLE
ncbi:MAG: hypothetical protein K9W46_01180 [Candidatus Heimdallarchaeum endolithica]|uniref:ABC3 transporter permease protein domain-containing protein n=1 Tax=Candidatus Heimdallarchaeum endolithica TaxID=2876572 RepID=A0A9Y1FNJ5_9ARCH|nr:MAG: hypothetical protein K9W46_01180 [Candidatus Heimdallarchaeum endolithica]